MTGIIAQNVGRTSGLIKSAGGGGGAWTLIKTLTASGDSDLSFVDGTDDVVLDSTYPIYLFKFINIHPENNAKDFVFQANAAGGSGYNETITSTMFLSWHNESGDNTHFDYRAASTQAQGTNFQELCKTVGADNDHCCNGYLYLFNPSSTTFVKHFISTFSRVAGGYAGEHHYAGYFNTTSAIDEFQFKIQVDTIDSGNIDSGKIKLYGLKDSA